MHPYGTVYGMCPGSAPTKKKPRRPRTVLQNCKKALFLTFVFTSVENIHPLPHLGLANGSVVCYREYFNPVSASTPLSHVFARFDLNCVTIPGLFC